MTASQTIDTLQFGTSEIASKKSGSNSNVEKSNKFGDIFENINKGYSSQPKESQTAVKNNQTANNSDVSDVKKNQASAQTDSSVSQPVSDNKTSKNDEGRTENANPTNTDTDSQAKVLEADVQESVSDEVTQAKTQPVAIETQIESTPVKTDLMTDTQPDLKSDIKVNSTAKVAMLDNQELIIPEEVSEVSIKAEPTAEDSDSSTPAEPIKIADETLDLITQAAIASFAAPINQAQAQSTNQQNTVTADLRTSAIPNEMALNNAGNVSVDAQNNVINQLKTSVRLDTTTTDAKISLENSQIQETQTPLVQVATDAIASKVNSGNQTTELNQNVKNATSNSSLTQEVLDTLDAKVVAVSTTNSSTADSGSDPSKHQGSKGLLTHQNAQEQAIKLELQSNDSPVVSSPVLTATTDTTLQGSLGDATALSGTTQAQNSAPVSKELSQSDIMSQIDKQLNLKAPQSGENTKVSIILRPENLGKIELELVNTKEGLTAKMTTDNAQVKELLDKSLENLRDTLGAQGVSVNNVSVKISESQKQDTMFSFDKQAEHEAQQQQQQENAKHANWDKAAFESNLGDELSTDILGDEIEPEVISEVSQNSGKVDYKV